MSKVNVSIERLVNLGNFENVKFVIGEEIEVESEEEVEQYKQEFKDRLLEQVETWASEARSTMQNSRDPFV